MEMEGALFTVSVSFTVSEAQALATTAQYKPALAVVADVMVYVDEVAPGMRLPLNNH